MKYSMRQSARSQGRRQGYPHSEKIQKSPAETRLYHFPEITLLGKQFQNYLEISQKLDILLKNYNLLNDKCKIEKSYVMKEFEGGVLFRCKNKGCLSFLKFQQNVERKLVLVKSDIEHEHKVQQRMKGTLRQIRIGEIQQCYDQLFLLNFKPSQILNFIQTRFRIDKHTFYAVKYARNKRDVVSNLVMSLKKYDHFFFQCKDLQELAAYYRSERLKPEKRQDQDVVIVVSQKMKTLYEQYHAQYVLFSIFPELAMDTKSKKNPQYHHIGILYGEDAAGGLNNLFGIVFMRRSIRLAYLYIMEKLFNFLGRYPKVLITDYDPNLAQAVRKLQKRLTRPENTIKFHLQLPNSFISNSFHSRANPQFISILSNDLQALLLQPDKKKHDQRFRTILDACELNPPHTQSSIAQLIRKYVRSNSIIYLPNLFTGLSLTHHSIANQLRTRVLDYFKSPRPMVLAIKAFFEIFKSYSVLKYLSQDQIQARLNPPKEDPSRKQKINLVVQTARTYEGFIRLKSIPKSVSQPAALAFGDSLQRCFCGNLQVILNDGPVYYRAIQTENTYPYLIKRVQEMRRGEKMRLWRCSCLYYSKTGLPCWHEIKVCAEEGSSIVPQISPFWLLEKSKKRKNRNEEQLKYWNQQDDQKVIVEQAKQKLESVEDHNYNSDFGSQQAVQEIQRQSNKPSAHSNQPGQLGKLIHDLKGIQWRVNDDNNDDETFDWKNLADSRATDRSNQPYTSNPYFPQFGENPYLPKGDKQFYKPQEKQISIKHDQFLPVYPKMEEPICPRTGRSIYPQPQQKLHYQPQPENKSSYPQQQLRNRFPESHNDFRSDNRSQISFQRDDFSHSSRTRRPHDFPNQPKLRHLTANNYSKKRRGRRRRAIYPAEEKFYRQNGMGLQDAADMPQIENLPMMPLEDEEENVLFSNKDLYHWPYPDDDQSELQDTLFPKKVNGWGHSNVTNTNFDDQSIDLGENDIQLDGSDEEQERGSTRRPGRPRGRGRGRPRKQPAYLLQDIEDQFQKYIQFNNDYSSIPDNINNH